MFRNKQWIYNLIALIILLTGMCFDEVRADSVFPCADTGGMIVLENAESMLLEVNADTTEILCMRSSVSSSQLAVQITNSRRTIKLSMIFLCVAVFSLLLSNFYTVERVVEYPRLSTQLAVLKYIHNTDGKK